MKPIRDVLKIALVAATIATPFWGAFGFLMVGAVTAMLGFVVVVVAPIFFED